MTTTVRLHVGGNYVAIVSREGHPELRVTAESGEQTLGLGADHTISIREEPIEAVENKPQIDGSEAQKDVGAASGERQAEIDKAKADAAKNPAQEAYDEKAIGGAAQLQEGEAKQAE
jgi:hypothetical protein